MAAISLMRLPLLPLLSRDASSRNIREINKRGNDDSVHWLSHLPSRICGKQVYRPMNKMSRLPPDYLGHKQSFHLDRWSRI